jgi:hypothetical protein
VSGARREESVAGQATETAIIRLLAPAHKSRLRLLLMALLLITWIAILILLYLATPHLPSPPAPASSRVAMAFPF